MDDNKEEEEEENAVGILRERENKTSKAKQQLRNRTLLFITPHYCVEPFPFLSFAFHRRRPRRPRRPSRWLQTVRSLKAFEGLSTTLLPFTPLSNQHRREEGTSAAYLKPSSTCHYNTSFFSWPPQSSSTFPTRSRRLWERKEESISLFSF